MLIAIAVGHLGAEKRLRKGHVGVLVAASQGRDSHPCCCPLLVPGWPSVPLGPRTPWSSSRGPDPTLVCGASGCAKLGVGGTGAEYVLLNELHGEEPCGRWWPTLGRAGPRRPDTPSPRAAGGMRRGNMGHLTRIANAVVQNLEGGPLQSQVSEVFQGLPADCRGRWESFVEETLSEANRRNAVDLVSTHHLHPSSEDEDMEGVLPSELSLQQAFSEYQVQQMTATFVDQFGFSDEEFAEQDDSVNAPFDRIAEISFSVDADDDSPGAALFEACCSDHIQPFDEDDDLWEAEETHRAARVTRARFGGPHASERCPKDGPERRGQGAGEGVDAVQAGSPCEGGSEAGSSWAVFDGPVTPMAASPAPAVARDVGSSVWAAGSPSTSAPEEKGWAKFADFQPFCCSESGPRCSSPVDTGHGDAQAGLNHGPERALGAWSTCVPRKAPLVAASSREDEQKAAAALEAVGVGPSQKASPLSMSGPRADCAPSSPPGPAPLDPAEAPTAPAEAAVTGPAPRAISPVLAVAIPPGPMVAVTTAAPASPAVSMAAALGTVTRDRQAGGPPPSGAALNGPV